MRTATPKVGLSARVQDATERLDAHVRDIIEWHFNHETGCPFWLDFASTLNWDPRREIHCFADLRKFPPFEDEWLRGGPIRRWVPKGLAHLPAYVFETGGTTGVPKSRVAMEDFRIDYEMFSETLPDEYFPRGANWLMLGPSGPRRLRLAVEHLCQYRGGVCFCVDLDPRWVIKLIKRAAKAEKLSDKRLPASAIDLLAELAGGDARIALNTLELALRLKSGYLKPADIEAAAQTRIPGYDKAGENHYNIISAFIKSLRGSQASAALYYMARMLQAGEDPKFIARRMVIFASEDIGLAAPAALNLAVSTFLAVERIGLPEAQYNLFHCAAVLAKAPKSRQVTSAMSQALAAARSYPDLPVPLHLRNAPTKLMKELGYGEGYKWQADFKHTEGFWPPELANSDFFGQA